MQHFIITVKSVPQLQRELNALCSVNHDVVTLCNSTLVQIYTTNPNHQWLNEIEQTVANHLPEAIIVGCSALEVISPEEFLQAQTVISFLFFKQSQVQAFSQSISEHQELDTGQLIGEQLSQNDHLQGVLLLATPLSIDCQPLLQGMQIHLKNIPIFGGGAGNQNIDKSTFVFYKHQILDQGIVAVALSGERLRIQTFNYLGWIPFGNNMTITSADYNIVHSIDHQSAYQLYRHFIDIDKNNFFDTSVEFPLILHRNQKVIARVPLEIIDDQSLRFFAEVKTGDQVQFGYGDINAILSDLSYSYQALKAFQPEAIFVYSCCCRLYFLKEDARQEISPFKSIAPAVGFFTYGEFDSHHAQEEILNATIVSVAISETDKKEYKNYNDINNSLIIAPSKHLVRLKRLMHFISRMTEQLDIANQELKNLAQKDSLTGIYNRRKFAEKLTEEINRSHRYQIPLSLILIDIDHFKLVNDQYGHLIGDKVLIQVTHTIKNEIRQTDLLARFGGEEFVIILPETKLEQAAHQAERIRKKVAFQPEQTTSERLPAITCSFGISSLRNTQMTFEQLLDEADKALYQAKSLGRNQVCLAKSIEKHKK
ncbi:diguanylate cyclase [Celerinatantimonas sp. YJH-8]|uniref:sensor domain-containing diguanylate cyclase n=1 Tax=Celerinatantimonas sp. YJH-8 TaxID=3228714 RepID=UPI0038C4ED8D